MSTLSFISLLQRVWHYFRYIDIAYTLPSLFCGKIWAPGLEPSHKMTPALQKNSVLPHLPWQHPLLPYLQEISLEPPSCTLHTDDGGRLQVVIFIVDWSLVDLNLWDFLSGTKSAALPSQPLPGQPSCPSWTSSSYFSPLLWSAMQVSIFQCDSLRLPYCCKIL